MMNTLIFFTILCVLRFTSGKTDLENAEILDLDIDHFIAIKHKCGREGGSEAYNKLKASENSLRMCIAQFANFTSVKDEVKKAKKTRSMNGIFDKYCAKRPQLAACVKIFTDNLRSCLYEEEREALDKTLKVLKQLGDSTCNKHEDKLATFVAEGGPECILWNMESIKNCIHPIFEYRPATVHTNPWLNLFLDTKKCKDLWQVRDCVTNEMITCMKTLPNIVHIAFTDTISEICRTPSKPQLLVNQIWNISAEFHDYYLLGAPETKTDVLNTFQEKCSQNAPNGSYEEFRMTFEYATECFKDTMSTRPNIGSLLPYQENTVGCFNQMIKTAQACLPNDEKYWPEYYLKSILKFFDFLSEILTLAMLGSQFLDCPGDSIGKELATCYEAPKITSLTKESVCGKLATMQICLAEQFHNLCVHDYKIQNSLENFFRYLTEPCRKLQEQKMIT